ncbi:MAG: type II toxin-antitoxin system VapC family toxin [Polaromonas sp.]|nr:type II toxin-antitoxin system VapC family toxin [Polaromonas sp.]
MATRVTARTKSGKEKAPLWIVLDSSCWIEYLRDSPRASLFAAAVENPDRLIVPIITVYEVTKKLKRELSSEIAAQAEALMCRSRVIDIDRALCRAAIDRPLPLADSLIYATAQIHGAILWTQDSHFDGLPGVKFFAAS